MNLDQILASLNETPTAPTQKTASAQGSALDAAIQNALSSITGSTKTASADAQAANSPVNDLLKIANELRNADVNAEKKLAHELGAAWTDGMMERLELHRKYAEQLDAAAETAPADPGTDLEKFAAENPAQYAALVQAGVIQPGGYSKEAFDHDFEQQATEIHAVTSAHFLEGYRALGEALSA